MEEIAVAAIVIKRIMGGQVQGKLRRAQAVRKSPTGKQRRPKQFSCQTRYAPDPTCPFATSITQRRQRVGVDSIPGKLSSGAITVHAPRNIPPLVFDQRANA